MSIETVTLAVGEAAISHAASLILAGLPIAVPTETVYGLAADATSGEAVARIYEAKGRPAFNPLIIHVDQPDSAAHFATFSKAAWQLAEAFWPGPLTLVLPSKDDTGIAGLARAGLPTIAVRVPAHPVMRALLAAAGRPLAAPSANASGRISPTRAEHVAASLSGRVPLILDGGATDHGLESTIVAVDGDRLRLLRPGPLDIDAIAAVANMPILMSSNGKIEAPGQLSSHYAPNAPLRLNATEAKAGEWMIGFGAASGDDTLSASGNLIEAAARLFETLHRADTSGAAGIAIAPVPTHGLGLAINDRLQRAAAPR